MEIRNHAISKLFFTFVLLSIEGFCSTLPETSSLKPFSLSNSGQINSNSILVALLDSHYTKLSKVVEKALLLQTLEDAVGMRGNPPAHPYWIH
ncbi:hypothetical protein HHK36_017961 [Tetracentron sinense]|uniref:Uncharacterized protein n=1 Tax=Tetracentron sinense TaxID=13715 RepID=A0A834YV51_TETSI|nr:hypothetical protein HHK36_017961 [Tetracentron sinense]